MTKPNRYIIAHYKLVSVAPAAGMYAVYAEEIDAKPGKYQLVKYPIYFIGVANVVDQEYTDGRLTSANAAGEEVVGLDLQEGSFMVCNNASNFAGLMREGDDINTVKGYLTSHYLEGLEEEPQRT